MRRNARVLKPLSAHQCKTEREIRSLPRDNWNTDNGWLLVNAEADTVTICQQRIGEVKSGWATLPRKEFAKLARAYLRPQRRRSPNGRER